MHSRRDWKFMALGCVLTATHLSGTDVIVNLPHGLLTETGSLYVTPAPTWPLRSQLKDMAV